MRLPLRAPPRRDDTKKLVGVAALLLLVVGLVAVVAVGLWRSSQPPAAVSPAQDPPAIAAPEPVVPAPVPAAAVVPEPAVQDAAQEPAAELSPAFGTADPGVAPAADPPPKRRSKVRMQKIALSVSPSHAQVVVDGEFCANPCTLELRRSEEASVSVRAPGYQTLRRTFSGRSPSSSSIKLKRTPRPKPAVKPKPAPVQKPAPAQKPAPKPAEKPKPRLKML